MGFIRCLYWMHHVVLVVNGTGVSMFMETWTIGTGGAIGAIVLDIRHFERGVKVGAEWVVVIATLLVAVWKTTTKFCGVEIAKSVR